MDSPLLTIGAFARAVGLTASALRHYDECGLLRPAEVDNATGYRYYTPDLAERARQVAQLRTAGVPIDGMRAVLDDPQVAGRAVLLEFLAEQQARSARTAAAVGDVLASIETPRAVAARVQVSVRGPELAAALRQVRPAADLDPTSPLSGVLLDLVPGSVDVVATNRYWMADRTLPVGSSSDEARAVLSRASAAQLATRLDAYDSVELEISCDGVTVDDHVLAARPEPYPAHRILLAGLEPPVTRAVLDRNGLLAAVQGIGSAEVVVTVSGDGADVRSAPDARPRHVDGTVTGPAMTLRIGSALGLRAVTATLGEQVEWALVAPDRPVRISSPYQPGFLALLMPFAAA